MAMVRTTPRTVTVIDLGLPDLDALGLAERVLHQRLTERMRPPLRRSRVPVFPDSASTTSAMPTRP